MAKVGIDIDGVLARFDEGFTTFANNLYGYEKIPVGYIPKDWYWSDVLTKEEESNLWKNFGALKNFWLTLNEFPNLQELCKFLAQNQEHDVWFISSRAKCSGMSIAKQTQLWLQDHMGPFFYLTRGLVMTTKSDKKRQVIEGMGVEFMIDDHGETIVDLDESKGVKAFLLDRNWNQHVIVKNRIKTFAEYLEAISKSN